MKKSFVKGIRKSAFLVIALIAFLIFTGNKKPGTQNQSAGKCCSGYNIATNKLKKFMLDSLHGIQFEGGVYSKADLIAAINKVSGDSVYLMNVLKNCSTAQGTDLAITSSGTNGVVFVRQPNCYPCPGKACCPARVCATRINRSCINYQSFTGFTNDAPEITTAGN
jgi:hypothetical protein